MLVTILASVGVAVCLRLAARGRRRRQEARRALLAWLAEEARRGGLDGCSK